MASRADSDAATLLEMSHICKDFSGVKVLRNVAFSVRRAEIVCLLGENGAGKSTLMKILAGVHTQYSGRILLDGKPVRFRSTSASGLDSVVRLSSVVPARSGPSACYPAFQRTVSTESFLRRNLKTPFPSCRENFSEASEFPLQASRD